MLGIFKTDGFEQLQKELLKETLNEDKIAKLIASDIDINQKDNKGRTILFSFVAKGKISAIKILLKNGMDINLEDKYGKTVLDEAIYKDDNMMIRFILEEGASLDKYNSSGRTLMQDIALEGNSRVFRILMKYNPNLELKDSYGKTVLFDAVEGGNLDIVKEILNNIEDINVLNEEGQSVLFNAVFKEDTSICQYLIDYGVDVNILDVNRQNVLFNAIVMGSSHMEIIYSLVEHNIKLNQKDIHGKNILVEILKILSILKTMKDGDKKFDNKYKYINDERDYLTLTSFLIDSGLAVNRITQSGKTLLKKEVDVKNYEAIDFLLKAGANINAVDKEGKTVLFDAVLKGPDNQKMIDYLIENNADYDHRDNNEKTIVDELAEVILIQDNNKKPSSRRFLSIDAGADYYALLKHFLIYRPAINRARKDGRTILFDIIIFNNLELLKLFFNAGIDANIIDNERNTPLSVLVDDGLLIEKVRKKELFLEKLVFFLKFRIAMDITDKNGRTVFHKAVLADDIDVVEKLLSKKTDLNIKDKQGRTALHHTQWKGNYKIARLLIAAGANLDISDNAGFSLLNYAAILGHTRLVVALIASGVLMYNKSKKSQKIAQYFKDKEEGLERLVKTNLNDEKMKQAMKQVVENLKNEIQNALK